MQIENGMVSGAWPYNAPMDDELTPNELAQVYGEHRMTNTRDYIVFDRTGTLQVVVPVKTEIGGDCPQSGNREVEYVNLYEKWVSEQERISKESGS